VAEGVETTTQLAFLRTLNCDTYQGYLYSKPIDTMTLETRYTVPAESVLEDCQGRAITMTSKATLDLPVDVQ
jgi:predicted signal transduction protein with EAL and GGDEF domain